MHACTYITLPLPLFVLAVPIMFLLVLTLKTAAVDEESLMGRI